MLIQDRIYGEAEISEPLLVDLLGSLPVKRLHGIHLGGITALLGIGSDATRHDHALGVMLLVRRLGGTVEEQAAALLHDVSHTALGHGVDDVLDRPFRRGFHVDLKLDYLAATEVPAICADHGVDWRRLADGHCWPLLEQEAPRLCADRVDYIWRDVEALEVMTLEEVRALTAALRVRDGRMVFEDRYAARAVAEAYLACDQLSWSNPRTVGLYTMTAELLRRALDRNVIRLDDLWITDAELWEKLAESPDAELRRLAAGLSGGTSFAFHPDGEIRLHPKVHTIDPEVLVAGAALPLSTLDPAWRRKQEEYRRTKAGEWRLRLKGAA